MANKIIDTETGEVTQIIFGTPFNYDPKKDRREIQGPSMTVPDQAMTMEEILRRYNSGLSLTSHGNSYEGFTMEELLPDLRKMDLADIEKLRKDNDAKLQALREEIVTKEKQKREHAELQAREKWFNEETERRAREAAVKEQWLKDHPQNK